MTWPPICPYSLRCALIDGLAVAVLRPITHRRITMSFDAEPLTIGSAVFDNPYVKVTPGSCGSTGCQPQPPKDASRQKRMLSGPNILAHGPLITYEQVVNCKSALYAFHNGRELIMCVSARCITYRLFLIADNTLHFYKTIYCVKSLCTTFHMIYGFLHK